MAWAFRSAAETVPSTGSNDTTITIAAPSGAAQNDLAVACIAINHDRAPVSSSGGGWTKQVEAEYSVDVTVSCWWLILGASPPADWTWTWPTADGYCGGIALYTGIDTADAYDVSGSSSAQSTTPTSPSVTTTANNALVVRFFAGDGSGAGYAPLVSDETLRGEGYGTFSGSTACGYGIADSNQASLGATGTSAWTPNGSPNEQWVTATIAFNELVAAGGGTPMHYFRRRHGLWLPKREKLVA